MLLSSAGQGAHSLEFVNLPGLEIQERQDTKLISSVTMYLCVSKAHFPFPLLKKKYQLQTLSFERSIRDSSCPGKIALEVFAIKSGCKDLHI